MALPLLPCLFAVALGLALVRVGWGGRVGVAAPGWALALGTTALLGVQDGAWGVAAAGLAGMLAALALLCWAGWCSPARSVRPQRERRVVPPSGDARAIGRRVAVFVLVVPVACAAALWLAFGVQAIVRRCGLCRADAAAVLLFLFPLAWCALLTWQMTRRGPGAMVAPPLLAAGCGTVLWLAA